MESDKPLSFGLEPLDKLFASALVPPSTIVVAGHPGAGKTTLASTICYANALKGHRCLYISFQEDRDKFFKNMRSVGMDLSPIEEKGLILFIRLPVVLSVDDIVGELSKIIAGFSPRVIVVDSINAILMSVADEVKRAWLQNYFYELAKHIQGLMVLVAELPFGVEQLGLGSIEFVVDGILLLKHRIEEGRLVRVIEVRKMRGSQILHAEIPFAILPGRGLKVYLPPVLEEIQAEGGAVQNPCKPLDKAIGELLRGNVFYICYQASARPPEVIYIPLGYVIANRFRTLMISFRLSPRTMRNSVIRTLKTLGLDDSVAEGFVDRYYVFKSFNPFAYSSTELMLQLIEVVDTVNPDMVVLHAFDIFAMAYRPKHFPVVYNIINYLKGKNILTFILTIEEDEYMHTMFTRLSDAILRLRYRFRGGGRSIEKKALLWKREREPYVMSEEELSMCVEDISKLTSSPQA